jgi:tripartite-type tricarboxylate transporter receptor subunit TctC
MLQDIHNGKGGMKMVGYSKSKIVSVVFAVVLTVFFAGWATAQDKYPSTAINDVVFSSAGGATDMINRYLGVAMEKTLGQKIMVSNMPGGLGGTAAEYVWQQKHDGYTLLGLSDSSTAFLVSGATKHGVSDWISFIAAGSPGVMAVKAGSPYKDLESLLKAAKDKPKAIKISNPGTGKVPHLKVVILEKNSGVQFLSIPYNGTTPSVLAVLSGEVDVVSATYGEISEQVRAGKLKIIAVNEDERIKAEGVESIPCMIEKYPDAAKYFPLHQWLGFAVPKDVPAAVVKILGAAFEKAALSADAQKFYDQMYMKKIGLWGDKANKYAQTMESNLSWISKELGVAKIDPGTIGIPKPAWAK